MSGTDVNRMGSNDLDNRRKRVGEWFGAGSIIASAASFGAFVLYGRWHWELVRLQQNGESVAAWRWRSVEALKLLNVAFGVVAVVLLVLALGRRSWIAGLLALAVATLCLWTVPLLT